MMISAPSGVDGVLKSIGATILKKSMEIFEEVSVMLADSGHGAPRLTRPPRPSNRRYERDRPGEKRGGQSDSG